MVGWMDRWKNGWMCGYMYRWIEMRMYGQMEKWMDVGWMGKEDRNGEWPCCEWWTQFTAED